MFCWMTFNFTLCQCLAKDLHHEWTKTPHSLAWNTLHNEPLATQLAMFRRASAQINAQDVKSGFRAFATDLLARGLIDMSDYVAIFWW